MEEHTPKQGSTHLARKVIKGIIHLNLSSFIHHLFVFAHTMNISWVQNNIKPQCVLQNTDA